MDEYIDSEIVQVPEDIEICRIKNCSMGLD